MINRIDVERLLETEETPFYVFREKEFITNYNLLLEAFKKVYKKYQIAYSYKTNYTPYVCKIVRDLGGYAEVVSDMEYMLAKKIGYDNKKIIYNGPCKGKELEEHLINGGINNIDNFSEALTVVDIAQNNPNMLIKVGIRINSDIGANYVSRFGLELDSVELDKVVEVLKSVSNIKIVGVHCHVSRARGLSAWEKRIENLIYAADKYVDGVPEYIDLGSGMFSNMEESLSKQFNVDIPSYEEYANVVAGKMFEKYGNHEQSPMLITEPGTTIIARYFSLITTVRQIKTIQDKVFATVDSSLDNAGSICKMKKIPTYVIEKGNNHSNVYENADIMGYTCLEQDCIYQSYSKPISVGDIIVFDNVGGYSIVSKPPFIHPNCSVFCLDSDNKIIKIKKEESFDDIFHTFIF